MNYITKLKSSKIGIVRTITVALFGPADARSAPETGPFGVDSNPIPGLKAVFAETSKKGNSVCIGYFIDINDTLPCQPIAEVGEMRTFSTDKTGALKFNIWQRNDGTCLIGDSKIPAAYTNNFVKYTELDSGLQAALLTINANFTALYTLLGTPAPPVNLNITAAKTTKIKTN